MIEDRQVKRILIDSGSLENTIRWKVVDQLSMSNRLTPSCRVLNGFNMACEIVKGEIILLINIRGMLNHTRSYVNGGDISYNAIFLRPWIHDMKVVPSTLHLLLKFSTLDGIKLIRGEQSAAREMFSIESHEKEEPNHKNMGTSSAEKGDDENGGK
ncbi:uncharacterized protein LOC132643923 [Lycium barbarum]|uniref:uncharacterized protein LOC132643923 n=1 Tax=Lycium barbarum TaxID=112863 RepID=UPI00293F270E|nr:uncharacterized protein LOC132643923 [Lycium barbarum]